jgi:hypothetical protein
LLVSGGEEVWGGEDSHIHTTHGVGSAPLCAEERRAAEGGGMSGACNSSLEVDFRVREEQGRTEPWGYGHRTQEEEQESHGGHRGAPRLPGGDPGF